MRIEVWGKKPQEEMVLRLRLIQSGAEAAVVAVDTDGEVLFNGSLLRITTKGKLYRSEGCMAPGITTDSCGRILLDE